MPRLSFVICAAIFPIAAEAAPTPSGAHRGQHIADNGDVLAFGGGTGGPWRWIAVERPVAVRRLATKGGVVAMLRVMGKPVTRDEILQQIRSMSFEDREYIEAELMREGSEAGHRTESTAVVTELVRRAQDALTHPERGISREDSIARATAAVAAAPRKP